MAVFSFCYSMVLWLERNVIIFKGTSSPLDSIWHRGIFLASMWCSADGLFRGVSLLDMQRDWYALLHGLFIC